MVKRISVRTQYERGLDAFNQTSPLFYPPKIKNELTLPAAERNPGGKVSQSRGKILSSGKDGGLIRHRTFNEYEYDADYYLWIPGGDPVRDISFATKCDAFQIMTTNWSGSPELWLRDLHSHRLKRLYEDERYFLYIAVSKIYFLLAGAGPRTVDIVVNTFNKI